MRLSSVALADVGEASIRLSVALDDIIPHACGAHPHAALTIQRAVDHHFLARLAVRGDIEDFIGNPAQRKNNQKDEKGV